MSEHHPGDDRVSLGKGDPDPSAWSPAPEPYPPPAAYPPPTQPYPSSAPWGLTEQSPRVPYGAQNPYGEQYAPPQYGQQYGQTPYGQGAYGLDPFAPFGRDPHSGLPLSDKSKIIAGLLQFFLGWLGIGRFYMGSNAIAVCQLLLFLLSFPLLFFFGFGVVTWFAVALWTFIDAIVLLVGNPRDGQGRLLRS
ncbi:MAG: TM2 domain-containing protein [Gordonia paraffinivorans]